MTLNEIKAAVDQGKTVCWSNEAYEVVKARDEYLIVFIHNDHAIGLTWRDGVTMNGKPEEFFVKE